MVLTGEKHKAYGLLWDKPDYGYISLYLSELPSIILIGFAVGCSYIAKLAFNTASKRNIDRLSFYVLMLLAVLVWSSLLNYASKQTLRYVMPVIPELYIVSAYGFCKLFSSLKLRIIGMWKTSGALIGSVRPRWGYVALLLIIQGGVALSWSPDYNLYFNTISGGLAAASQTNRSFPIAGVNEALTFLHSKGVGWDSENVHVVVLGDPQVPSFAYYRMYSDEERRLNSLGRWI